MAPNPAPNISVIVVVRNGERFLSQALDSIQRQTCTPAEVILVDGRSSDRTPAIARSYAWVQYVEQAELGLANARNLGLERSSGELIAFLDYDDLWTPDKLETQVQHLLAHPELSFVTGQVKFFGEPGFVIPPSYRPGSFERSHAGQTPGALLARRGVFVSVGGFDPDLAVACDSDWFVRALDGGIRSAVLPQVVLHKRIHETNLSSQHERYQQEWLTVLRRSVKHKRQNKQAAG